jgi:hypothetical protein
MDATVKIIGKILLDTIEEAENAYEALDIYSSMLHKRILLKEKSNIDYKDDLETYITLQGYRSEIANFTHREALKNIKNGRA